MNIRVAPGGVQIDPRIDVVALLEDKSTARLNAEGKGGEPLSLW
jgi:hypothetical protein